MLAGAITMSFSVLPSMDSVEVVKSKSQLTLVLNGMMLNELAITWVGNCYIGRAGQSALWKLTCVGIEEIVERHLIRDIARTKCLTGPLGRIITVGLYTAISKKP
jgi:hypothetical protein